MRCSSEVSTSRLSLGYQLLVALQLVISVLYVAFVFTFGRRAGIPPLESPLLKFMRRLRVQLVEDASFRVDRASITKLAYPSVANSYTLLTSPLKSLSCDTIISVPL